MSFSSEMRQVALDQMTELGNPCILTQISYGEYDPATGKTQEVNLEIPTYYAPTKKMSAFFGMDGINTGLAGFNETKVIVPWVGQAIDTTWKFNNNDITHVEEISAQGDIIVYNLTIAEDQ